MDISTVIETFKDLNPLLSSAGFFLFLSLYMKFRDVEASVQLINSKLTNFLERVVTCEQEIKDLTTFVNTRYNLTPADALKYLHRHVGCQSVEK